jgi:hypothetical protein
VVIRKADKSRQIVIMNRVDYTAAVYDLLNVTSNYTRVPFNGKHKCAALIIATIKRYSSVLSASEQRDMLLFTKSPSSRALYCLPKSHKDRAKWAHGVPPMRPICPDVRTETSMSAKFIAAFLTSFVEHLPTYVANSYSLVKLVNNLTAIPKEAVWLVADIDQLYPSIPVTEAFDTIRALLTPDDSTAGTNSELHQCVLDLLQVHLNHNYLEFNGEVFLQTKGIPMGKAWAPAVACIYMGRWDREFLQRLSVRPILFVRYIDDLLLLFPNAEAAKSARHCMDEVFPNIKVGDCSTGTDVHFLDLHLELLPFTPSLHLTLSVSPRLGDIVPRISLHRKPTDLIALLHLNSAHTWSVKTNCLQAQCIRISRLSNSPMLAGVNIFTLLYVMKELRCLPLRTLRRLRQRVVYSFAHDRIIALLNNHGGTTGTSTSTSPSTRKTRSGGQGRRTLLSLPMNIDYTLFRKYLQSLLATLSPRELRFVGRTVIVNQRRPKLQSLLFK